MAGSASDENSHLRPMTLHTEPLPLTFSLHGVEVRSRLLDWFLCEGRSFPWRSVERAMRRAPGEPIHDPYMILVSEVMLQQTQTSRVAEKLPEFLERFPTVEALASASRGDLIRAWQGMGYNRRALRLQEAAAEVVRLHGGVFPASFEELAKLPGVGRYTASAVACFAFGIDIPVVDVNVIRVFSRIFHRMHSADLVMPERSVGRIAEAMVPAGDSYRWHQALMDFGATVCTARRPACERCPVADLCASASPPRLELFGTGASARSEPELRGVPRRIWRGRVVELLRRAHEPMTLGEVIDRLFPAGLFDELLVAERAAMVEVADGLMRDGLVVRAGGVVREGGLTEGDLIALPA
jgi:A/G-specific adenine glycosylase